MYRIQNRICRQLRYLFCTISSTGTENNILSGTLCIKNKQCFNKSWFRPSYSARYFRILSCVSKDKPPDNKEDWRVVESKNNAANPPETSSSIKLENSETNVIIQSQEFLGIEVFPEIFDKLPPKCTGCGVILQSFSESKPGFIPQNKYPTLSKDEENSFISEVICSRCFNLKHYSKDSLPVVAPEAITGFLKHISRRKALILYIIDVMDVPGSFVPDILKLVGEKKHLILVCNKIDRLAVDGHPGQQMKRIEMMISHEALKYGLRHANICDICIVSAKIGFGIDKLVRTIIKYWKQNSDIYIVGSNNSGKTTLFNLFVDLFAASRQMENMLQRGTVSPAPATTLSLLRYPITFHRMLRLKDRLHHGYRQEKDKKKLEEVKVDKDIIEQEMTKYAKHNSSNTNQDGVSDLSLWQPQLVTKDNSDNLTWLFDTPGIYNNNQITHLLTNKELKFLNPSLWFVPRTFILTPGKALFIGGLARLDYLDVQRLSRSVEGEKEVVPKASQSVFFTVFASPNLTVHVTSLEKADAVYKEHLGSDFFKVPHGGKERMEQFPALTGRVMEVTGLDWKQSAADVILSNVGWIAVTAGTGSVVSIKAYTPGGVGLFLRDPSLLPTCVRQRGRRGVPYLGHVNYNMYQGTRKKSPSLVKILSREENSGVTQWIKVAEKKRKQQRSLIKFEKMKWHSLKKLGFSAKSNPTRYLDNYDGFEELDGKIPEKNTVKLPSNNQERGEIDS